MVEYASEKRLLSHVSQKQRRRRRGDNICLEREKHSRANPRFSEKLPSIGASGFEIEWRENNAFAGLSNPLHHGFFGIFVAFQDFLSQIIGMYKSGPPFEVGRHPPNRANPSQDRAVLSNKPTMLSPCRSPPKKTTVTIKDCSRHRRDENYLMT